MRRVSVLVLYVIVLCAKVLAGTNYVTNQDGDFDTDIWDCVHWKEPGPQNGNLDGSWSIEHEIYRTGDVNVTQAGSLYGTLTVYSGNFSGGGAFTIYSGAKLEIFGNLTASQKITVNDGGQLIVHGDVTLSTALAINSGGSVEIKGSLTTSQAVNVSNGATLIIGTNLNITGSSSNLSGDVVVGGDVDLKNTTVSSTGNFVVGGDMKVNNGGGSFSGDVYMLDPDAEFDSDKNNITEGKIDSLEDLLNDPEDSKTFIDIIDDIVSALPGQNWQGTSDDWSDTGNWTSGEVPSTGDNVVIPEGASAFPTRNTDGDKKYCMWKLTLEENTTLIVPSGSQVTVYGDITIPASSSLIIQNSEAAPTSFICYGEVNGDVTVQWDVNDSNRYYYMGLPVSGTTYADLNNEISGTDNFKLYSYPGSWNRITGGNIGGAGNELEGYAFKVNDDVDRSIQFSGTLNNDSYSKALNGNNLIANPYPSYIDILSTGISFPAEADKTIYTSTNASGVLQYVAYNYELDIASPSGQGSQYIAPGQAFWIVSSSGEVTVNPEACTHTYESGKGSLKSVTSKPNDILRLELSSEGLTDEVAMVFRSNGQMGLKKSDSAKRLGNGKGVPNIYGLKGNSKVAIGLYPETANIDALPLGYKFDEEKELTISAINVEDFAQSEEVYLVDKNEDLIIDLRETAEYTFIASNGEENDRFELRFEASVTTELRTEKKVSHDNLKIYVVNYEANIWVSEELLMKGEGLVEVYNIEGQLISKYELNSESIRFNLARPNTVYIVKVNVAEYIYQQKIMRF